MADSLVIVESPAKAKTIGKYLGQANIIVKASMGHIRDLPKSQIGVEVDNDFHPKYITIRGKGSVLKELKDASKKVKKSISRLTPIARVKRSPGIWRIIWSWTKATHAASYLTKSRSKRSRTRSKRRGPINMDLVNAQQARRILDRLVGYKISPLLWKKVKKGLSAGRVQSVAVKLIIDRENEIDAFVPEEYWSITAQLKKGTTTFEAKFHSLNGEKKELGNEAEVQKVLDAMGTSAFTVSEVKEKERLRNPAASVHYQLPAAGSCPQAGFRASKTMSDRAAAIRRRRPRQRRHGRSHHVHANGFDARSLRSRRKKRKPTSKRNTGRRYAPETASRIFEEERNAQDAHEAIRPTSVLRDPDSVKEFLSRDQFRLYKLVWERFVASQMASAVLDTMTVDLTVGNGACSAPSVRK